MHRQHLSNNENVAEDTFEIEGCNALIPRDQEEEEQAVSAGTTATKQQQSPASSPVSPPSAASSPSRDFSFAISLHPSATTFPDKCKGNPPSLAIDLSPADDIFFHGHLLPLHLLSHLSVSPRSSTNSIENFSYLAIRDSGQDRKPNKDDGNCSSTSARSHNTIMDNGRDSSSFETKRRSKKSNSIVGLMKWRKESEVSDKEDKQKSKRKMKFDVGHVLKKYLRMVQPLVFFKSKREDIRVRRQAYSFSAGSLNMRNDKDVLRGRRGEYSAPASMRTSPTNSGLLVASTALPSSANDSTMEELQAAIQAAIAHCKNSIAAEKP